MSPETETKVISYLKRLRHEMSYTPYEFEREIKELDELLADEKPETKIIPIDREPKINEML